MTDIRQQLSDTRHQGSAELALRRHNLTSPQLLKLAHAAANAGLNRMKPPPPLDDHERQDLVAALVEYGLRWALVYDPNQDARRNFATSVYSRMRLRVVDWCRTNIHDARFGTDKRHLVIDPAEWDGHNDDPDLPRRLSTPKQPWSDSTRDAFIEPDFQEMSVSNMHLARWQHAADRAGLDLNRWIVDTLDAAALLEEAA